MSLLRSSTKFIARTTVTSTYLTAQSVDGSIVGPRSIDRFTCDPTAIVVATSELLRTEDGKLQKDKEHEQKYISERLYRPEQSRYQFSHAWVLFNRF